MKLFGLKISIPMRLIGIVIILATGFAHQQDWIQRFLNAFGVKGLLQYIAIGALYAKGLLLLLGSKEGKDKKESSFFLGSLNALVNSALAALVIILLGWHWLFIFIAIALVWYLSLKDSYAKMKVAKKEDPEWVLFFKYAPYFLLALFLALMLNFYLTSGSVISTEQAKAEAKKAEAKAEEAKAEAETKEWQDENLVEQVSVAEAAEKAVSKSTMLASGKSMKLSFDGNQSFRTSSHCGNSYGCYKKIKIVFSEEKPTKKEFDESESLYDFLTTQGWKNSWAAGTYHLKNTGDAAFPIAQEE